MAEERDKPVSALPAEDIVEKASETQGAASASPDLSARTAESRTDQTDQTDPAQVQNDDRALFAAFEIAAEDEEEAARRRKLNAVVHGMWIAGLTVSTVVIFVGLSLSAVQHRSLPPSVSSFRQVIDGLKSGSPSSYLDLGVMLLIATPFLRVVGSLIEFVNRRDWRYVAITSLVLLILAVGVSVGG